MMHSTSLQRQRRGRVAVNVVSVTTLILKILLVNHFLHHVDASFPNYLRHDFISLTAPRQAGGRFHNYLGNGRRPSQLNLLNRKSLYSRRQLQSARWRPQSTRTSSTSLGLMLWDILEPFETAWEFYANRDDILDTLLANAVTFAKRNSVRFVAIGLGTFFTADVLTRLLYRKQRGGIIAAIRNNEDVRDTFEEKSLQKITRESAKVLLGLLHNFRRFGGMSKFAVAFSAGVFCYNSAIQATTTLVKLSIGSFIVVEVLSFAGLIGEPGESILEWLDDHRADANSWNQKAKDVKIFVREHLSLAKLEDFYEVAVDEEKVACMGFAIGSICAMIG